MALIPSASYPGQVASDADYPQGKARNVTVTGDGTGTPWEAALVNDIFGFQQALLAAASITPSGNPDKVGTSQYLDAIRALMVARPNQIIETGAPLGASLINTNFHDTTPTAITNSTMTTAASLLTNDRVQFEFSTVYADNTTPGSDANVLVQLSLNGGAFGTIYSFKVLQHEKHFLPIAGQVIVSSPGIVALRLAGINGSVSDNTNVSAVEQGKLIGKYIVIRP